MILDWHVGFAENKAIVESKAVIHLLSMHAPYTLVSI